MNRDAGRHALEQLMSSTHEVAVRNLRMADKKRHAEFDAAFDIAVNSTFFVVAAMLLGGGVWCLSQVLLIVLCCA